MGAGREEIKFDNEVLQKKEKGSLKKSLIVTMEPEDRYFAGINIYIKWKRRRGRLHWKILLEAMMVVSLLTKMQVCDYSTYFISVILV